VGGKGHRNLPRGKSKDSAKEKNRRERKKEKKHWSNSVKEKPNPTGFVGPRGRVGRRKNGVSEEERDGEKT